jgi:hypothetical protein
VKSPTRIVVNFIGDLSEDLVVLWRPYFPALVGFEQT